MRSQVDSDVDLRIPRQRVELRRAPWAVLGAISAGGALGALARYGLAAAWPHRPGRFPWATFVTNVSGCLLIGVLMVLVTEVWSAHRLLRPFLGVGVLGGYTTYSSFAVEVVNLVDDGAPVLAAGYVLVSVVGGVAAVALGVLTAGRVGR